MSAADKLVVLRDLVQAHSQLHPRTGQREPIYYFQGIGPSELQHHALTEPPSVDDALLEEMHLEGWIDIDYHGNSWSLVPTPRGRELVEGQERVQAGAGADVAPLVSAVARQAEASNKFGWPAVRPVLAALRTY